MERPTKSPTVAEPAPATQAQPSKGIPQPQAALSTADFEFLRSLDAQTAGDDRVRSDMIALLTDDETIEALAQYAPVLASLGLAAAPSTETLQYLERLQRLRRRLELAQAVVTRHIQSKGAPSQS